MLEPQHILDTRWVKQGNRFNLEHLVQWHRLPVEESTWEDATVLRQQFPQLDLEDKVPLHGGILINHHSYHYKDPSDVVKRTPNMMFDRVQHALRFGCN